MIGATTEAAPGPDYGTLFHRFVAALIDNLLCGVAIGIVLGFVPEGAFEEHPEAVGGLIFVLLTAWFNYFAVCEWRWGQTVGKNAMRMRVTTVEGEQPRFGAAAMRNLLRLVDWLVIGWVMIAATARRQRLGDKAAGTVVVRIGEARAAGQPPAPSVPSAAPPPPTPAPGGPENGAVPAKGLPWATWGIRETLWGLLLGIVLGLLLAPALVLPFDPGFDSLEAKLAAQALLGGTLIAVAVWIARSPGAVSAPAALRRLGLRRFAGGALGWMLLALFAYYVIAALYAVYVIEPEQEDIAGELGLGGESALAAIAAVVLIAGLAPVAEEVFFRGFLFAGLRARMPLWPAAILAGALFGAIHAPTGVSTVVPLSILGVALAWLYERTGSLWPCVIAHALNNGLALAVTA